MKILSELPGKICDVISRLSVTSAEKKQLETDLLQSINHTLEEQNENRSRLVETEMKGIWLQRAWRPIVMLVFTLIVLFGVFIDIPLLENSSRLWNLLELGLGGYVIGRSAEKITGTFFKNRKR